MAAGGKQREPVVLRMHPEVALHVLEEERDLLKRLERAAGFPVEMRDDPLLKPDEFRLVVKGAGRDVTQQYVLA
jgi:ribonuclease G